MERELVGRSIGSGVAWRKRLDEKRWASTYGDRFTGSGISHDSVSLSASVCGQIKLVASPWNCRLRMQTRVALRCNGTSTWITQGQSWKLGCTVEARSRASFSNRLHDFKLCLVRPLSTSQNETFLTFLLDLDSRKGCLENPRTTMTNGRIERLSKGGRGCYGNRQSEARSYPSISPDARARRLALLRQALGRIKTIPVATNVFVAKAYENTPVEDETVAIFILGGLCSSLHLPLAIKHID
uniref:Uncharacterized protein n=1 Tax=Vespula pensylvanica TaxID=30213 RepID=A0A834PFE0_VESPE|nr:hypothetical protein H0235_001031 [Vespula pensylvanica]